MKLVLDTNVILTALIRDSLVRAAIVSPRHQFFVPESAIEEIHEHLGVVELKSGLPREEIQIALNMILLGVDVVTLEDMGDKWKEAVRVMERIDIEDAPFVGAALSMSCDGIWSDDKHLKRQKRIRVWTTKEILAIG